MGKVVDTLGEGLITGPATIVSGILGARAQNKATEASERANNAALAFSREQENAAQGRYGQSKAQYDKQVSDWYAARNALLGRYGVDINLGAGGLQGSGPAPTMPGVTGGRPPSVSNRPPTATNRSPIPTGSTLGDLAQPNTSWNDWNRYGI